MRKRKAGCSVAVTAAVSIKFVAVCKLQILLIPSHENSPEILNQNEEIQPM